MATTRMMADLFRALAAEDIARATILAGKICKAEERIGHRSAARLLRGALHSNGCLRQVPPNGKEDQPQTGAGLLATALVRLLADVDLKNVVLNGHQRREIRGVVSEWRFRDFLRKRGLPPRSKLLFHGPPGCGKSLTARALGKELGIPVHVVRFDAVVGAYLGQTAINLRLLFSFAEQNSCILLLDELDAIGRRRGNPLDVGELDRIVIALMQELEHSKPMGLIIGTSNLPKHLDEALWRRFDLTLQFGAPKREVLRTFAKRIASKMRVRVPSELLRLIERSKSFADAESLVVAEARRQALSSI